MKMTIDGVSSFLILSVCGLVSGNEYATYASIHRESAIGLRPLAPTDIVEGLIEHSFAIPHSKPSVILKNAFCANSQGCIIRKLISNPSARLSVSVSTMDESNVLSHMPNIYHPFLPILSSQSLPSPKSSKEPNTHLFNLPSPTGTSAEQADLSLPRTTPDSISSSSLKNLQEVLSLYNSSNSSSLLQMVNAQQRKHITSFYFKQLMARYMNWCYTNDYAHLIYPFLPDEVFSNPQLMRRSVCTNRLLRNPLLILFYTHNQLSSKYAMNLLFTYPLYIYLQELNSYIETSFHGLQKIVLFRSKGVNMWKQKKTYKTNNADPQRFPKMKDWLEDKNGGGEGEQNTWDDITDTILIGCKAILKVPYYLSQDPNNQLFSLSSLHGNYLLADTIMKGSITKTDKYLEVTKKCEQTTDFILKAYEFRKERKVFRKYFNERHEDQYNGRLVVFPEFPLPVKEVRSLSRLEEEEETLCSIKGRTDGLGTKAVLLCLDKLVKKFSLLLGMIASHSYLLSQEYTKKVVPVLEKLQALQLVAIYFKARDEYKGPVNKEDMIHNADVVEEDDLKLQSIIRDVVLEMKNFVSNIQGFYVDQLEKIVETLYNKEAAFFVSNPKFKAFNSVILNYSLDDFYDYIEEKIPNQNAKDSSDLEKSNPVTMPLQGSNIDLNQCDNESVSNKPAKVEIKSDHLSEEPVVDSSMSMIMENSTEIQGKSNMEAKSNCNESIQLKIRQEKYKILDEIRNRTFIFYNLMTKISHLRFTHPYDETQTLNNRRETVAMSNEDVLEFYASLDSFYQLSIPIAFFLNRKIITSFVLREADNLGLSRGKYSFPGNAKSKQFMSWGHKYAVNLRKTVLDDDHWSSYFKGRTPDRSLRFSRTSRPSNVIEQQREQRESDVNPAIAKEEIQHGFNYKLFAADFLQAMQIITPSKKQPVVSLVNKFSSLLPLFLNLMNFYEKMILNNDPTVNDRFKEFLNENRELKLSLKHGAEKRKSDISESNNNDTSISSIKESYPPVHQDHSNVIHPLLINNNIAPHNQTDRQPFLSTNDPTASLVTNTNNNRISTYLQQKKNFTYGRSFVPWGNNSSALQNNFPQSSAAAPTLLLQQQQNNSSFPSLPQTTNYFLPPQGNQSQNMYRQLHHLMTTSINQYPPISLNQHSITPPFNPLPSYGNNGPITTNDNITALQGLQARTGIYDTDKSSSNNHNSLPLVQQHGNTRATSINSKRAPTVTYLEDDVSYPGVGPRNALQFHNGPNYVLPNSNYQPNTNLSQHNPNSQFSFLSSNSSPFPSFQSNPTFLNGRNFHSNQFPGFFNPQNSNLNIPFSFNFNYQPFFPPNGNQ